MSQIKVKLDKVDEKKKSVKFETDDQTAPVTNIYIKKSALKGDFSKGVTVTVDIN